MNDEGTLVDIEVLNYLWKSSMYLLLNKYFFENKFYKFLFLF